MGELNGELCRIRRFCSMNANIYTIVGVFQVSSALVKKSKYQGAVTFFSIPFFIGAHVKMKNKILPDYKLQLKTCKTETEI